MISYINDDISITSIEAIAIRNDTEPTTPVFTRSDRAAAVKLSEIVQISETVQARKTAGEDILSFGTGEPDFPTPENIIQAAHAAMLDGQTTYPPTQGTPALRKVIAENTPSDPAARPDHPR